KYTQGHPIGQLNKEIEQVTAVIPIDKLAIQWYAANEIKLLEAMDPVPKSSNPEPLIDQLARLGALVIFPTTGSCTWAWSTMRTVSRVLSAEPIWQASTCLTSVLLRNAVWAAFRAKRSPS
ncbi:MAG: hypothetical protein ACREP9_18250, partial [Candidatus Dormibacteraceae bacterium]